MDGLLIIGGIVAAVFGITLILILVTAKWLERDTQRQMDELGERLKGDSDYIIHRSENGGVRFIWWCRDSQVRIVTPWGIEEDES